MKKDLAILLIIVSAIIAFLLGYALSPSQPLPGKSAAPAASAPAYEEKAPGYSDD
jgi:hypothetical protein